jgi:hypothetical protein
MKQRLYNLLDQEFTSYTQLTVGVGVSPRVR